MWKGKKFCCKFKERGEVKDDKVNEELASWKRGRKKEKEDLKKPGGGGAALEYVRKLRKMEEQATTAPAFPLGTNLQVHIKSEKVQN